MVLEKQNVEKLIEEKKDIKPEPGKKEEEAQYYGTPFKVSYRLNLIQSEAAYSLNIDSQLPVQSLVLQSNLNVEILNSNDKSLKLATNKAKQGYLGIARIESSETRRVTLKIRTSEGQ